MLKEIPRRAVKNSSTPPPRRENPKKKDVLKLTRAMNATTNSSIGGKPNKHDKSAISEDTFVQYMSQGESSEWRSLTGLTRTTTQICWKRIEI